MKLKKKALALLLMFCFMLTLGSTALAADNGSITINDAVPDETYTIYRLFNLESYNASSGAYAYKINTTWKAFAEQSTIKGVYINIDDQGYVTWVENADAAEFAKLAKDYAVEKPIANDGQKVAPKAAEGDTYSTVTFTGLPLGYYLVDTSLGALCSLDTTKPSVVIEEKNAAPTVEKEVKEDSTGEWGETNDASIGDTVEFKAIITAQAGAENYVLHDTMSAGLTFNGVTSITLNGTSVEATDNYTITQSTTENTLKDDCTFEVAFSKTFCDKLKANDTIIVYYNATVNESAVIAGAGNPNDVVLKYGDSNNTLHDKTTTYVWEVNVFKFTKGESNTKTPLAGATFKLTTDEDGKNAVEFVGTSTANNYKACVLNDSTETHKHITEITTDSTGKFHLDGLDSGTYYLHETKAPEGYNKLSGPVAVTISNTGAVNPNGGTTETAKEVQIENKTGALLPETGGIGTKIFYVVGASLMVGAAVMLISRRKTSAR